MARGSAEIDLSSLPSPIMPTWKGEHNRIKWSLRVIGDVGFWPDISDDYEIEILPLDTTNKP